MPHPTSTSSSGMTPLRSFLALRLPSLLLLALALAACGTAAPRAAQPAAPAGTGGMAPTMAKEPTSAGAAAIPAPQAAASGDPRGLGNPDAPIKIIEYSDYQ